MMQDKSEKSDQNTDLAAPIARLDRLSALVSQFRLSVGASAGDGAGRLAVYGGHMPEARFWPDGRCEGDPRAAAVILPVDWGGAENPLLAALPDCVVLRAADDAEAGALLGLILTEAQESRCGAEGVLSRLAEVLLIRLLRAEIARGTAEPGLVGGLACPRIGRALVAMHTEPGRAWTNEALAAEAALSLSRFAEIFAEKVGETPQSYLRRWRLTLARQALARGGRVGRVAQTLGYRSAEALTRAFRARYGASPRDFQARRTGAEAADAIGAVGALQPAPKALHGQAIEGRPMGAAR